MIQKFEEKGYKIVNSEEEADIYIINTCTVTNMSDRKSRQMLRRAHELNKDAIIVAVGCYADVAKEELSKIKEINLILGNSEKKNIVDHVENYINHNDVNIESSEEYNEFGCITYTERTRATIKVQDGCNNFCTYCIIPYARGRIKSRKKEIILEEIEKIAEKGIKEVVITGIHIASYGKDFDNNYRLIDLLEDINKIEGIERIRIGSLEPTIINEEFCDRIKKLNKLCHHFHLSLQSGCNGTLKRMNRKYSTEEFEKVVELLRETYNDVMLTTDIIVGFPGETDEEFNITYNFLEKIKFYKMHVFKYSIRKGTVASKMDNQVSNDIKDVRSKALIELSNKNELEYLNSYLNKKEKVLFEDREGEFIKGHTENYLLVKVKTNKDIENTIKEVKLNSIIDNNSLLGELK